MEDKFRITSDAIRNRRSVKPAKMNGKIIPDETVKELIRLADWAPTHKITEPWRFIVYPGDKAKAFALEHAELYKSSSPAQEFDLDKYEKILGNGKYVSHIIIAVMKRSKTVNIPEIEEIAATAAAIENLLIAASSAGLAGFWSTGGMTHKKEMKEFLRLDLEDIVMGIIYLGYTDSVHEGKRIIPLDQKVDWK
jgi:nitroreductase